MRVAHLSRLRVPGGSLEDLALLHCEWALGLERFASLRSERLSGGVPEGSRPADLLGDKGEQWQFRFSMPTDTCRRTSIVRVREQGANVDVEHLVIRERTIGAVYPSAAAPETVLHILGLPGVLFGGRRGNAVGVTEAADVSDMVDMALADRAEPLILISVDNHTGRPLVSPEELAERLAGMARVISLATVSASRRLKDELCARGFSEKFGCFHGGVRILWPGIQKRDDPYDHLLLLPVRLHAIAPSIRTERVAGHFSEMISESEDLRGWLRQLESPAPRPKPPQRRAEPSVAWPQSESGPQLLFQGRAADAASPSGPAEEPVAATPLVASSEALAHDLASAPASGDPAGPSAPAGAAPAEGVVSEERPPSIEAAPAPGVEGSHPAPVRGPTGESTWARLVSDVSAAAELAEELGEELEATRNDLLLARKAQRRAEQERDEAVEARVATTVADAVTHAEALFEGRLVLLSSARSSAQDAVYRQPVKVFQALALLAFFGRNDADLECALDKTFAKQARFRPKDSAETTGRYGSYRTWSDLSGHRKLFRRHITLGHGVGAQRCAQIYYDITSDGIVEVAWVGEHRPTVSEDT